jgi:hypothetical protein
MLQLLTFQNPSLSPAHDILYWKKPLVSALLLAIGVAYFFAVGVLGWSSLGFFSATVAYVSSP